MEINSIKGAYWHSNSFRKANYRTIFMTKFGMTLFDFEFGENGFVVHKVLEQMDRKVFLKIIEQDMEMLLSRGILGNKAIEFEKSTSPKRKVVFKAKLNKKTHFFVQEKHHKITEIHQNRAVSILLSKYIAKTTVFVKIKIGASFRLFLDRFAFRY